MSHPSCLMKIYDSKEKSSKAKACKEKSSKAKACKEANSSTKKEVVVIYAKRKPPIGGFLLQ